MRSRIVAAAAALLALPAVSQAGEVAGFTTSGYVDVSTQVNDWDDTPVPGTGGLQGFTNVGDDGDISLNQVALKLTKTPTSGFGAVIGVVGGDSSAIIPGGGGEFALTEGYVQYTNGMFTVIGGKFFTLAGYEVFASTGNAQATRGLLFNFAQPLSLTGVRGTAKLGDVISVSLGAVNEIDGDTTEPGEDQKAIEGQLALTAGAFTAALTHYKTSENQANLEGLPTALTDLVVAFTAGGLNLGLNYDLATFDDGIDSETSGFAVYAGYAFTDAFKLSGRFETLTFEDNVSADVDQTSLTVTGGFACSKEFDLLAEARMDSVDSTPDFTGFDGDDSGNTFVLKGIYKF